MASSKDTVWLRSWFLVLGFEFWTLNFLGSFGKKIMIWRTEDGKLPLKLPFLWLTPIFLAKGVSFIKLRLLPNRNMNLMGFDFIFSSRFLFFSFLFSFSYRDSFQLVDFENRQKILPDFSTRNWFCYGQKIVQGNIFKVSGKMKCKKYCNFNIKFFKYGKIARSIVWSFDYELISIRTKGWYFHKIIFNEPWWSVHGFD